MTTRGINSDDCVKIAELIDRAIQSAITLQEGSPKLIDFKNSEECSWRIMQIVMNHFFAKEHELSKIKNDLLGQFLLK